MTSARFVPIAVAMSEWTIQTLRDLDRRYAEKGLQPHQRPFRAAVDILGSRFSLGVLANPEVQRIIDAYEDMLPEVESTWPGLGTGLVTSLDRVRRVTVPVVYGEVSLEAWQGLGFGSSREWWAWCREDREIATSSGFSFADIMDFAYGFDGLQKGAAPGAELWTMAASNLSDVANTLPGTFSVDSVLQPIWLTAELALKAAIVNAGKGPTDFRGRGGEGHDLVRLAARLATETPHRDDLGVAAIVAALPPYVDSRYEPTGLSRLQVVRLALGAQFVAAATVRRHSTCDFAADLAGSGMVRPPILLRITQT